jgi:phosphoribosylanthranilate isomerase
MTRVKICGLRRLEDARIVNEGRPDYIGFILTPSKRQVTLSEAAAISEALLPSIRRVGVFAGESPAQIARTASQLSLDGIQLHLDTTSAFADALSYELGVSLFERLPFVWQRLPVSTHTRTAADIVLATESFADLSRFDGILLDTRKNQQDGGSGQMFPWQPAKEYLDRQSVLPSRIIVAGGLDEGNVSDAISFFEPYAVDVSSGVETNGYKDEKKVLRFIETVRKAQVHS